MHRIPTVLNRVARFQKPHPHNTRIRGTPQWGHFEHGLLGLNASVTARSYRGGDDEEEMSVSLAEETRAPGGNHRPTASNWQTFTRPVPSHVVDARNRFHLGRDVSWLHQMENRWSEQGQEDSWNLTGLHRWVTLRLSKWLQNLVSNLSSYPCIINNLLSNEFLFSLPTGCCMCPRNHFWSRHQKSLRHIKCFLQIHENYSALTQIISDPELSTLFYLFTTNSEHNIQNLSKQWRKKMD